MHQCRKQHINQTIEDLKKGMTIKTTSMVMKLPRDHLVEAIDSTMTLMIKTRSCRWWVIELATASDTTCQINKWVRGLWVVIRIKIHLTALERRCMSQVAKNKVKISDKGKVSREVARICTAKGETKTWTIIGSNSKDSVRVEQVEQVAPVALAKTNQVSTRATMEALQEDPRILRETFPHYSLQKISTDSLNWK